MAGQTDWPQVGETWWACTAQAYRLEGRTAPYVEYVVFPVTVKQIDLDKHGGKAQAVLISEKHELYYWTPAGNGGVYRTRREAAERAQELTAKHERAFPYDAPLRRTWEVYLNGETD